MQLWNEAYARNQSHTVLLVRCYERLPPWQKPLPPLLLSPDEVLRLTLITHLNEHGIHLPSNSSKDCLLTHLAQAIEERRKEAISLGLQPPPDATLPEFDEIIVDHYIREFLTDLL